MIQVLLWPQRKCADLVMTISFLFAMLVAGNSIEEECRNGYAHVLLAPYVAYSEPPECQKLWYGQAYLVGIICLLYPIGIGLSNLSKIWWVPALTSSLVPAAFASICSLAFFTRFVFTHRRSRKHVHNSTQQSHKLYLFLESEKKSSIGFQGSI